jgi:hypothetical protein
MSGTSGGQSELAKRDEQVLRNMHAIPFQIGGPLGGGAAAFYLVAYFVMTLGAFGVVTLLSERQRDADLLR